MAEQPELSRAFEALRPHLMRVAYGTLGSVTEAEDVVQEAWLRLQRAGDPAAIEDLRAWLITVVGRLALDSLRTARRRREHYVGDWLPEPIVTDPDGDPADRVTLEESVTVALLVVLERLSPAERTAFVLHDVFGMPFEEVGAVVGRSPAAVRQLAARARGHVEAGRPRFPSSPEDERRAVEAFAQAAVEGDLAALVELLDESVVWRTDGGGRVPAARHAFEGAQRVARAMVALARRPPQAGCLSLVNGHPGLVLRGHDGILTVMSFTIDGGRITTIETMRNPDKLRHVDVL